MKFGFFDLGGCHKGRVFTNTKANEVLRRGIFGPIELGEKTDGSNGLRFGGRGWQGGR